MLNIISFADSGSSSGIAAFGISWKSLIFQLITFLLVLFVFKRWVLPPINKTLEERRKAVEKGLTDARASEEALKQAEAKAEEILAKARALADEALAEAKKAGSATVAEAEEAAAKRAGLIIKEAETHLAQERDKLRQQLREELADLVADATEKVVHEKLDAKSDMALIERAIRGSGR